jgi:hypothetical protein
MQKERHVVHDVERDSVGKNRNRCDDEQEERWVPPASNVIEGVPNGSDFGSVS